MGQVSLKIGGYSYVVGCADGEEGQLKALGEELDRRVAETRAAVGNRGEGMLLVLVALGLLDEVKDLRAAASAQASADAAVSPELGRRLAQVAARLDGVAQRLARA
ncbi:MAG: cell division protein ZapA [Elioraea sp.]|nr:cell division protein ZapA [Elioraea sp.]MDW8445543.1 cell division protein ZapA [Acetobacteraceae bacterium]